MFRHCSTEEDSDKRTHSYTSQLSLFYAHQLLILLGAACVCSYRRSHSITSFDVIEVEHVAVSEGEAADVLVVVTAGGGRHGGCGGGCNMQMTYLQQNSRVSVDTPETSLVKQTRENMLGEVEKRVEHAEGPQNVTCDTRGAVQQARNCIHAQ